MININFVVQIVQEAKVSCSIKHSFRCPVMILVVVNSVSVKVQTSAGSEAGQCQEPQVSVLCPVSIEVGSLLRLFVSR